MAACCKKKKKKKTFVTDIDYSIVSRIYSINNWNLCKLKRLVIKLSHNKASQFCLTTTCVASNIKKKW